MADIDPIMERFERDLSTVRAASPLAMMAAVRTFVETAAAIIRDNRNRLKALERAVRDNGVVM